MAKLTFLVPARQEEFLGKTIEDLLENTGDESEILVGLDGYWPEPIKDNPRVKIFHVSEPIGQRAMQNQLCRLARTRYVAKCDAHCSFDKDFGKKMLTFFKEQGDDIVAVPVMRNLHAFDWVCECGYSHYQDKGKTCPKCGKEMRKEIKWIGKPRPQSTSYCFDKQPHFQYHNEFKGTKEGKIGTIVGYKILIDFSSFSPDFLKKIVPLPNFGTKPPSMLGIVKLLTDFASSHQFTVFPNSSRLWKNVSTNAMGFSPVDNGWGVGVQKVGFIRDKSEMERIATLPVLTDVVNYGYILSSSTRDRTNEPSVGESVCQGFLSEMGTSTVTPTINTTLPNPTTRRTLNSDVLDKFNNILGGEFVYSEKRKCFHNGSVALIPIHVNTATETMSLQGSFFMCTRHNYWKYQLCDDRAGSWGNQGLEIACAAWLSGLRVLCNHKTWYAHMFRTKRENDFGFPYQIKDKEVNKTKDYIKDKFWNKKHPKQIREVSWLIDKFKPSVWQ